MLSPKWGLRDGRRRRVRAQTAVFRLFSLNAPLVRLTSSLRTLLSVRANTSSRCCGRKIRSFAAVWCSTFAFTQRHPHAKRNLPSSGLTTKSRNGTEIFVAICGMMFSLYLRLTFKDDFSALVEHNYKNFALKFLLVHRLSVNSVCFYVSGSRTENVLRSYKNPVTVSINIAILNVHWNAR